MASDILVTTADGTLRGRRVGKLRAWRGIPYARPAGRNTASDATTAGHAVDRRTRRDQVRRRVCPTQEGAVARAREVPAEQRGLPDAQRARPREHRQYSASPSWFSSTVGQTPSAPRPPACTRACPSSNAATSSTSRSTTDSALWATSISPRSQHPSAYSTPTSDCAIRLRPCSGCNATSPPSVGILKKSRFSVNPPEPPPSPP